MAEQTTRSCYESRRAFVGEENEYKVFAHVIADAYRFLGVIDKYLSPEIDFPANHARMELDVLKEVNIPGVSDVILELRDYYQKGIAREMVSGLLQDMEEGMLRLEEIAGKAQ